MMDFLPIISKRNSIRNKSRATRPGSSRRPSLEVLEDRCLPSGYTISGHVFNDVNNNGIMDAGEQPIANVAVELHNTQNVVIGTAMTDANGYYQFDHDATVSTNVQTLTKTFTIPTTATDFTISGMISQFDPSLGALQSVQIINAGSITSDIRMENTSTSSPSTIHATTSGNLVLTGPNGLSIQTNFSKNDGTFNAAAFDGQIDFGGTSGKDFGNQTANGSQQVTLTGSNMAAFIGTGNVQLTETATATSSATGGGNMLVGVTSTATGQITVVYSYILDNSLKPGNYTVVKPGDPAGFSDGKESRNGVVLSNPPGFSVIPLVLSTGNMPNNDFGELKPSSLSGYVYGDISSTGFNNGVKDPGESGIAGVTLTLDGATNNGPVHVSTTTDASGFYKFSNLLPGMYSITQAHAAGWIDGRDTIGTPGGLVAVNQFNNINLQPGFDGINNNFGEIMLGQIGGTVYYDGSAGGFNNGIQDAGEQGIAGVTVRLTGTDVNGNAVNLGTMTDSSGNYQFAGLAPGTYSVTDVQPGAYMPGKNTPGSIGGSPITGGFGGISLAAGASGTQYNFGELLPSTVSGFVYVDTGRGYNNGIKESDEQGLSGVTITLAGINDQGTVNMQQITDNTGFYSFTGLRPGTYTITETHPAGYVDGKDTIGASGGVTGQDVFSNVKLAPNFNDPNNNFGELTLIVQAVHDPELPKDLAPTPPVFTATPISIVSKGQLLASTASASNAALSSNAEFVNSLYVSILGRTADSGGLAGWLNYLGSGGTRQGLVNAIWTSTEHRWRQVTALYQTFLGVNPDQGALNYYANLMQNGASELSVAATIAGGPQVAAMFPTQTAYVVRLFDVALGRAPSPAELTAWNAYTGDRVSLALAIFTSDEALGDVVQRTFLEVLGRPAGPAEVASRVAQLKGGSAGFTAMINDLFTSGEYASHMV
jgi:SdrD B-like domain/Domain of unknown function (DUF4214)